MAISTILVQLASSTEVSASLARIEAATEAVEHADLIVLPEAAMADFGHPTDDLAAVAQPVDGPFVTGLRDLAVRTGATVVAGMFEQAPGGAAPYNTLVAVGPDGELRATYRKAHLYDAFGYRESDRLSRGAVTASVLDVGDLRLGLMTCYDLRFPEHARALVDAGADVLVVPAAWVQGPLKVDHWQTLLRARAIENTSYVLAAAQNGSTYCGHSMVVDPTGVVAAALGEETGLLSTRLDPELVRETRETNPALTHRRWRIGP